MNIFISSTFSDLSHYREAARKAIERAGHRAEMVERLAGVDPQGVAQLLRSLLRTCHGCVLIVGTRRGSGPADDIDGGLGDSYTMIEYQEALRTNVPLLPFFVGNLTDAEPNERSWLTRFRKDITIRGFEVKDLSAANALASALSEYLDDLEKARPMAPSERELRELDRKAIRYVFGIEPNTTLDRLINPGRDDAIAHRLRSQMKGYPAVMTSEAATQADGHNDQGWLCHKRREYVQALKHYERGLEVCPTFPLVWNNKGLAHFRLDQCMQARDCFFHAIQLAPGYPAPWSNLAVLYWERFEDRESTRRWLDRALAIDPDDPDARVIAEAVKLVEELETEAKTEMDFRRLRLIQNYPRNYLCCFVPGMHAMLRSDFIEAERQMRMALGTAPHVVEFLDAHAECLCELKRYEEAAKTAKQAVDQDPNHASAWVNLSWAYHGLARLKDSYNAARKALAIETELKILENAIRNATVALCDMGAYDKAMQETTHFAEKHPRSTEIARLKHYVVGRTYDGRGG